MLHTNITSLSLALFFLSAQDKTHTHAFDSVVKKKKCVSIHYGIYMKKHKRMYENERKLKGNCMQLSLLYPTAR